MTSESNTLTGRYVDCEGSLISTQDPTFNEKCKVIGLAKTVKFLGGLDIFFSLYYGLTIFWPCIFLTFLSWCGYYGAKKYKPNYIMAYIVCIVIYTFIKGVLLYYSQTLGIGTFNTISLIMELYLGFIVYKFYKTLTTASPQILSELQGGWSPRIISFVLY